MESNPQPTGGQSSAPSILQARRVLTIDDSKSICAMLRRQLAGTEYVVCGQAHDGEEGFVQFMNLSPDIVLLDLVMPGRSGREVLRQLRAADPGISVVIVSSVGTEDAVRECLEEGATSFLLKPFSPEALLRVLRALPSRTP